MPKTHESFKNFENEDPATVHRRIIDKKNYFNTELYTPYYPPEIKRTTSLKKLSARPKTRSPTRQDNFPGVRFCTDIDSPNNRHDLRKKQIDIARRAYHSSSQSNKPQDPKKKVVTFKPYYNNKKVQRYPKLHDYEKEAII